MVLDRLMVPSSDQSRSRAFYERVFGFVTLGQERKAANDPGTTELRAPGAPLAITLVDPAEGFPLGSVQGAYLDVQDLLTARRHIEASQATIGPILQGSTGPYFHVNDPDGNGWIIRQI